MKNKPIVLFITTGLLTILLGCDKEILTSNQKEDVLKPSIPLDHSTYSKYELNDPREPKVLRTVAEELKFPLSIQDKKDIDIVVRKYDGESNMVGLAAPQIWIGKRIIVFGLTLTKEEKESNPYLEEIPKTIWINPKYEPVGIKKITMLEGCFSIDHFFGIVPRYETIKYEAYLEDGTKVQGQTSGYTARVIQHEIDHLNATGFLDLIPRDNLLTLAQVEKMSKKE